MPATYLVECYWPGATRAAVREAVARVHAVAEAITDAGRQVRLVHSTFVADDEAVLSIFEAVSVHAVHTASEEAGLSVDRISRAEAIGSMPATHRLRRRIDMNLKRSLRAGARVLTAVLLAGAAAWAWLPQPAGAIVGGERDCSYNALGTAGERCSYPTVGAMVASFEPTGWVSGCTSRLIYNGPSAAVLLTAAHCMQEGPEVRSGDGVTFDSQTVDDSVNPYARHVVQPDRLIVPDEVILHPTARSSFAAGTDPVGNSQAYVDSDFALLVIDDPAKLARLNGTWSLPYGQLVDLPAPGFFDTLTPKAFRELPLIDVGYGRDWINSDRPSGRQNTGRQDGNDGGFRSVADLSPTGVSSQDRLLTSQIQSKGGEGICYSDSGSSAFLPASGGRLPTIVAMPTWVNDGGTKCGSTVQWTRLDRPNALNFIGCGLAGGGAEATRTCVEHAFPPNS